ncbi:MAG: hypothetical protein IT236_07870 [Bacteroidia bacterium]|nr:hypothetical protein [Bacteroidia bacterium]
MPTAYIRRIIAENHVTGYGSGLEAQEQGAAFFKQKILPAIERVFEKYGHIEQSILIDKLELDINLKSFDSNFSSALQDFEFQLETLILQQIGKGLHLPGLQATKQFNPEELELELFLELITKGQLPWWHNSKLSLSIDQLASTIFSNASTQTVSRLTNAFAHKSARQRVALRLSTKNLEKLILLIHQQGQHILQIISETIQFTKTHPEASISLKPFIYQIALTPGFFPETPFQLLNNVISENTNTLPNTVVELVTEALEHFSPEKQKNSANTNKVELSNKKPTTTDKTAESKKTAEILKNKKAQNPITSPEEEIPASENNQSTSQSQSESTNAPEDSENQSLSERKILSSEEIKQEKEDKEKTKPTEFALKEEKPVTNSEKIKTTDIAETPQLQDEVDAIGNYHVTNAGIIILSPFLPALFKELELINSTKFVSNEAQEKAICILHYLLTDNEDFEEHYMLLNKIICGFPVHKPLIYNIQLTAKDKEECHNLLGAVAQHWTALKNTSYQNMRNAFFWRQAVVEQLGNGWNLKIERATIDVLVDKLPWGISVIKLSWNEEPIFVDWT